MAQVRFLKVKINRGAMTTLSVLVPQWEAQVLLALWGEEAEVIGEVYEERQLPDPSDEFTRLANKYGPRDEEVPAVAKAYGSFGPGLRALEAEFAAATVKGPKAQPSKKPSKKSKSGKKANSKVDKGPQLPGSDQTFGPGATPRTAPDNTGDGDYADLIGEGAGSQAA